MNKPNYLYLLVVLLSLVFATSAYAQPEIKAQSSLSQILGIGGVKEELGLSGDQYEALSASAWQIKSELEKVVKEYKDNFIPRLSDDKKAVLQYELEAGIKEIQANEIERLEKVLSSDQIQRLKQIRFQYMKRRSNGLQSLVDELGITDDQINDLKEVAKEFQKTMGELQIELRNRKITMAEFRNFTVEERKKSEEDLLDVLTTSQRKTLRDLEGERFEFDSNERKRLADEKKAREKEDAGEDK